MFNEREIALSVWLLILTVWLFSNKKLRTCIVGIWDAFWKKSIVIPMLVMLGYVSLVIYGLNTLHIWDMSQLKNTVVWFFTAALVYFFRLPSLLKEDDFFVPFIKANLRLLLIVEFVVGFYSFSFWIEFILIPIATVLVILEMVSARKKESEVVHKVITFILLAIALSMIINGIYGVVMDPHTFFTIKTMKEFALTIICTLLLMPFLFGMMLYMSYETAFVKLNIDFKDIKLRRYAKFKTLLNFHVQMSLLDRWLDLSRIRRPTDRKGINASISEVKKLAAREKNPVEVELSNGWSPQLASKYLVDRGLKTGDYHPMSDESGQWWAWSQYLQLEGDFIKDSVTYSLYGAEECVKTLKLVCNFNNPANILKTKAEFVEIVEELCLKSLNYPLPSIICEHIQANMPIELILAGKNLRLEYEKWPSGRGYELRFVIENLSAIE